MSIPLNGNVDVITDMLANSVETQVFQHFQIIHHCLMIWRRVQSIGPIALVQSTEHEDKLAIEQRSLNTIDHASGDCAEADVALHLILVQAHGHIVKVR